MQLKFSFKPFFFLFLLLLLLFLQQRDDELSRCYTGQFFLKLVSQFRCAVETQVARIVALCNMP